MEGCKNCNKKHKSGHILGCPNCGATYCEKCADNTKKICPNCYNSLEYIG